MTPPQSGLVLGTVQWGEDYGVANVSGRPSAASVKRMLAIARERGIMELDTARSYGEAESVIGELLEGQDAWRVVTKLAADIDIGTDGHGIVDAAELEARTIASIAASCRALRRQRLSVVLVHRARHRTACGGVIWATLKAQLKAGRIECLGVSALSVEEAFEALEDPDVAAIQVPVSAADRRAVDACVLERAWKKGVQVYGRSVFLQGALLLEPTKLPAHLRELRAFNLSAIATARKLGVPLIVLLLASVIQRGVKVIVGCETVDQVSQVIDAWEKAVMIRDECKLEHHYLPDRVLDPWRWPAP